MYANSKLTLPFSPILPLNAPDLISAQRSRVPTKNFRSALAPALSGTCRTMEPC